MISANDPLGVSLADLDAEIDALCEPPMPTPSAPLECEPPVIVEGLANEKYHADMESVGVGGLRLVGKSPLHHWYACRRDDRELADPTPAQRLGTAIHAAILEPERFASSYCVSPQFDRRTTAGKLAYTAFTNLTVGRETISTRDHEIACAVAKEVRASNLGQMLLQDGRAELSVYWTDRATGVRCRMRPDFVPTAHPVLIDIKSCADADDRQFGAAAWRNGYHVTAAWYVDGWRAVTCEKRDYYFVALEKEPPYAAAWFYASDDLLEAGRAEYRRLLKIYAECLAADHWPGYYAQLQPLEPPAWAMDRS